jgi:hypothetical protein
LALRIRRLKGTTAAKALRSKEYRRPVLFLGAGISFPSGLPLANEVKNLLLGETCRGEPLLNKLYRQKRHGWERNLRGVMLESVLEIFSRHCRGKEAELASIFLGAKPAHYHKAAAELLAGGHVITTNFDDLIETAYATLRRANPGFPELRVVVNENEIQDETVSSFPSLIKIHGCATRPETMALIVSQVGKGLPRWRHEQLGLLASHPFIFLGYSDRDKDISPALTGLKNSWAWICHEVIGLEEQIPRDSQLESMLSFGNRVVLYTDANLAFTTYAASLTASDYPVEKRPRFERWRRGVRRVVSSICVGKKHLIAGDIVYELLGDWESAEAAYSLPGSVPVDVRAELLLKRNRVYGDRWKLDELESCLNSFEDLIGPAEDLSLRIRAMLAHDWASLHQKRAIRLSEKAEAAYVEEEENWRGVGERGSAALARLNRAVVLQKRGRYKAAEPVYRSAIDDLRLEGMLSSVAKALVNFGSLLGMTGKNEEALRTYREASDIFFMLGEPLWGARLKVNIGIVLYKLGRASNAEGLLIEAKTVLSRFEDSYWLRNADMALKDVLDTLGKAES